MEYPRDNVVPFRGRSLPGRTGATFAALAQEWLRVESARLVAPENERRHIDHLRPLWALTELELRPRIVKEVLAGLMRPNGQLGAATVNKVRSTGRRIIREAQLNEEWTGNNPFDIVRRLRQERPSHRILSLAECRAVLPHLREDRRREVLLMLYLGPRPGEWKALRKVDVDFLAGTIIFRRSNGRDSTKTGKVRVVPIPDALLPVLEAAFAESPNDCALVFPGKRGERQSPHAKLARMLKDALRRAELVVGYSYACRRRGCGHRAAGREKLEGIRCPLCNFTLWRTPCPLPVRYYDLRHSAATLHREAGADPLAIQLALGHAPENLTDSLYTHLSTDYLRRELNKLKI